MPYQGLKMKYHETLITVGSFEMASQPNACHGSYISWMKVACNDLAGRFALDDSRIAENGYLAPVVALEMKFKKPLHFTDKVRVQTSVRRTETATLEFVSRIIGEDKTVAATGRTVHAVTDKAGILQYRLPPVIAERLERLMAYLAV